MLYLNTIKTITSDYTNRPEDRCLNVDTTSGNITITLRLSFRLQTIPNAGQFYPIEIRKVAAANTVTIQGTDFTINGATSYTLTDLNESVTLLLDPKNRNWMVSSLVASGGSGTVTNFSAGNLSPLFTTSVATSTTTPALSFTLSNASRNTWFGNNTTISAAPAYNLAGVFSKIDDTNVTATLYGAPSGSVLNDFGVQLGWTGQLSLSRGGTGANLSDPNADRILFWDDSAGQVTWLEASTGLSISGTTLTANAYYTIMHASGSAFAPADATSYFIANIMGSAVTTENTRRTNIGVNGTIVAAAINFVFGASPTSENSTIYVRLNNTTDNAITTTLDFSGGSFSTLVTGLNIAVTTSDYIGTKWRTPTWVTNPTNLNFSVTYYIRAT